MRLIYIFVCFDFKTVALAVERRNFLDGSNFPPPALLVGRANKRALCSKGMTDGEKIMTDVESIKASTTEEPL